MKRYYHFNAVGLQEVDGYVIAANKEEALEKAMSEAEAELIQIDVVEVEHVAKSEVSEFDLEYLEDRL